MIPRNVSVSKMLDSNNLEIHRSDQNGLSFDWLHFMPPQDRAMHDLMNSLSTFQSARRLMSATEAADLQLLCLPNKVPIQARNPWSPR